MGCLKTWHGVSLALWLTGTRKQAADNLHDNAATAVLQLFERSDRPASVLPAGGLSTLVREEGIRAAYRGLQPTVLALLPTWALYFSMYELIKSKLRTHTLGAQCPIVILQSVAIAVAAWRCERHCSRTRNSPRVLRAGARLSPTSQYIMASVGAGAMNVAVTNPLWVIKTRLQTQTMPAEYRMHHNHPTNYSGTLDAFRTMLRKEGWRGLYAGFAPSLIGIAHVAIQFPLYEALKHEVTAARRCRTEDLPATDLVLLSSAAKMVASTATYPHEVIRSQMHVSRAGAAGVRDVCRRVRALPPLPACSSRAPVHGRAGTQLVG